MSMLSRWIEVTDPARAFEHPAVGEVVDSPSPASE